MTLARSGHAQEEPPDLRLYLWSGVTGIGPALSAWESVASGPVTWPDLRDGVSASDRDRPLVTGVNGTLMARRTAVWPVLIALTLVVVRSASLAIRGQARGQASGQTNPPTNNTIVPAASFRVATDGPACWDGPSTLTQFS